MDQYADYASVFKALGDTTRLKLLKCYPVVNFVHVKFWNLLRLHSPHYLIT